MEYRVFIIISSFIICGLLFIIIDAYAYALCEEKKTALTIIS